jgi:starch synthase
VHAAIYFDPDAFLLDGPKLMGRQSAGNGYLRAAVKAHAGEPIRAVTPFRATAEGFVKAVRALDPKAKPVWVPAARLQDVAAAGVLYRPDLNLAVPARERLRLGPARYSLCGVTHTLSSHQAADAVADLLIGPVMPWDALVCTSSVARAAVEAVLGAQADYLAWRTGAPVALAGPQLPVIPLGVHCEDFAFGEDARGGARAALGLAADEVAALFVGRLTFSAKAHPFQMFRGLEAAAVRTGRKVVFLLAGQFPSKPIEDAFRAAPAEVCPNVRVVFVDGKDEALFGQAWRAADLFLSISDNYQETFGIAPLEAMAAGLPVVVSDWDGYKDTVRDGVDGFRIPTWAPQPGVGEGFAGDYESFATNYDYYISRTSTTVSAEAGLLAERLAALVGDADLRRRMGQAGAARARSVFDWAVVYRQYQALWRELAQLRVRRAEDPALRLAAAPRAAPARLDPFRVFKSYPTRAIGPLTLAAAATGDGPAAYAALTRDGSMLSVWREPPERIALTFAAMAGGPLKVVDLAAGLGEPVPVVVERIARLAKMELVALSSGQAEG